MRKVSLLLFFVCIAVEATGPLPLLWAQHKSTTKTFPGQKALNQTFRKQTAGGYRQTEKAIGNDELLTGSSRIIKMSVCPGVILGFTGGSSNYFPPPLILNQAHSHYS